MKCLIAATSLHFWSKYQHLSKSVCVAQWSLILFYFFVSLINCQLNWLQPFSTRFLQSYWTPCCLVYCLMLFVLILRVSWSLLLRCFFSNLTLNLLTNSFFTFPSWVESTQCTRRNELTNEVFAFSD